MERGDEKRKEARKEVLMKQKLGKDLEVSKNMGLKSRTVGTRKIVGKKEKTAMMRDEAFCNI